MVLKSFYKSESIRNKPPFVQEISLSQQKDLWPGEEFEISVKLKEPEEEVVQYYYFASIDEGKAPLEEFPIKEVPLAVEGEGPAVKAKAPQEPGIYRIYAMAVDPQGLAGVLNRTISVKASSSP